MTVPTPQQAIEQIRAQRAERLSVNPGGRMALAIKSLASQGLAGTGLLSQVNALGGNFDPYWDDTEELADPYKQEPWIAAGTNLLARLTADIRLVLWDRAADDPDAQEITDEFDPVWRLFNQGAFDGATMLSRALAAKHDAINLSLSGESVWFLRDEAGQPVNTLTDDPDSLIDAPAMYTPIRGDLVGEQQDAHGKVLVYRLPSARRRGTIAVPPGAVLINLEIPDHSRPGRGMGLLQQAWGPAAQSHLARRYNTTWLRNYGDPGGVLTYDGWLSNDQYRRVQQEKGETFDNPNAVGETALLEGGMKYEQSKAKPRDMAFETLLAAGRTDMSAVMGTPEGVLGGPDMTYATLTGHMTSFMFMRVEPYLGAVADSINTRLLPRLRDLTLSRYRVSFDVATIRRKLSNADAQGKQVASLMEAGVPRDEALARVELDAEPLETPDGEMPMVRRTLVSMPAMMVAEGAKAIKALREIAEDDREILKVMERVGLPEITKLRERPDPNQLFGAPGVPANQPAPPGKKQPPEPPAAPPAPAAGKETPTKKDLTGEIARDTSATPAPLAPAVSRDSAPAAPTRSSLTRRWNKREARIRGPRRSLLRAVSRVFNKAKAQQLEALRVFAESGKLPNRDGARALADVGPVTMAHLASFRGAWEADRQEFSVLCQLDPDKAVQEWTTCDGAPCVSPVDHRPRQEAWLDRHSFLTTARAAGLERLRGAALAQKAGISEEEIDRLIVVGAARFENELAKEISRWAHVTFKSGASAAASELSIAAINATDPAVLEAFASRSIQVAEGTLSSLANSIRRNVLEVFASGEGIGSLQDRIDAALKDTQAAVTRAFASHRHRAQTIAHTETGGADNSAHFDSARKAHAEGRIKGIGWVTSGRGPAPLGSVRKSHFQIESANEVIKPGETFSNGLRYPHDPNGDAGEVVNCQCALRYEFKEES